MARTQGPEAVLFDLDETLMDHLSAEYAGALVFFQRHPAPGWTDPEAFAREWHRLAEEWFLRYQAGETDFWGQRRSRMRALFGPLSDAEADRRFGDYIDGYERHWKAFDDVGPCLDDLQSRNLRLGIITNGSRDVQSRKLAALGLERRFEVLCCSADLGVSKPDPRIFAAAAAEFGLSLASCVFVGDRRDVDAAAATAAGMRGIWLNRKDDLRAPEVETVLSLEELGGLI
jgi:putative hydrolase of the HAD superfamily